MATLLQDKLLRSYLMITSSTWPPTKKGNAKGGVGLHVHFEGIYDACRRFCATLAPLRLTKEIAPRNVSFPVTPYFWSSTEPVWANSLFYLVGVRSMILSPPIFDGVRSYLPAASRFFHSSPYPSRFLNLSRFSGSSALFESL